MMNLRAAIALSLLTAAGCAPIESETRSAINVDGRSYELRTQVIDGPRGPYERSSVVVRNRLYTCLPASPGDCEATVRLARTESDRD